MNKGKDLKPHIGIFGRRNNGKSSIINILTGQDVAIVSDFAGTTTDPVKKSVEIPKIGPSIIIDTAGIDDTGELGEKRIKKSFEIIKTVDIAIIVISENNFGDFELNLINELKKYNIPYIIVHNKADISPIVEDTIKNIRKYSAADIIDFSTVSKIGLNSLIESLKKHIPEKSYTFNSLIGDFIKKNDLIILVTPIDEAAPEGRLILPQQMTIRDILDNNAISIVMQETELELFLKTSKITPALIITDSQAFNFVKNIVPENIPITSFSIIFSRLKGDFENFIKGTPSISKLKDNDKILILESCTHHVSCNDIGRVKIPKMLSNFTNKKLSFTHISGLDKLPKNLSEYKLVIQCGGCMVTRNQIINRLKPFVEQNIPISNYGMAIAYMNGIFEKAINIFNKKTANK
ncbi:MAG: [FeFe] hydrogenase H-cluster maturation GTPase HydF [Bacteroidales bacterium]|nr:[FeFe] hydrogenase H-cluster maturation GTPase HydF [Bacteroidales bacterium]